MVSARLDPTIPSLIHRTSWAAVFAGLFVAVALELLCGLLGVGMGASTVHAVAGAGATASSIGIASALWLLVSTLLVLRSGTSLKRRR